MTDASDLATWFRPHVTQQQDEDGEDKPQRYVRLKTGNKSRRLANDLYLTELVITGRDPADVANEVMGAIHDYASADPTWVEVLEVNGSTIKAVCKLDPDEDPSSAGQKPVILDPNSMMSALVVGITSSNATLNGRVSHLESALENSWNARVQLAERVGMSETLLIVEREKSAWIAEHSGDEYGDAIKLLTPLLAPIGGVLAAKAAEMAAGGGKKKKEPKPEAAAAGDKATPTPETAGEKADRVIAEALDLAEKEPAVLRERAPQLMVLGLKIQGLLTAAA